MPVYTPTLRLAISVAQLDPASQRESAKCVWAQSSYIVHICALTFYLVRRVLCSVTKDEQREALADDLDHQVRLDAGRVVPRGNTREARTIPSPPCCSRGRETYPRVRCEVHVIELNHVHELDHALHERIEGFRLGLERMLGKPASVAVAEEMPLGATWRGGGVPRDSAWV